ncbi:unnamed protein product [Allacma fusca]|uniref:Large ribosomal subunit protein bL21m n=1 Tax=Allacma fusca TaxID=39272 RepID=A0A8J2KGQ8_9HEXA|nr:unnamed protein product [Allacma fusca]
MRRRRPRPPKDQTHHYPDYMHESMPNQEDNEETTAISKNVFENINQQIAERSHGRLFAVIQLAGKQFKVSQEDIIIVQGYWAPTVGDQIRLEKVLLAGSVDFTLLGRPMLPRDLVRIEATVIEKKLSYTKLRFLLIKRKNHRRLKFYKTPYTMVRINSIEFDGLVNERKEIEGERNTILY